MIRPITSILTVGLVTGLMGAAAAQPTTPMQQQHADDHTVSSRPAMESHHSFGDAEKWAKEFDDPQRDALQKPDEVLDALHLRPTDKVADIGAGTGYFTVRIATRVPDGKVFRGRHRTRHAALPWRAGAPPTFERCYASVGYDG
jgi:hypothetical protein